MKKQTLWILLGVGALVLYEMQKNQAGGPSVTLVPPGEPVGGGAAGTGAGGTPAGALYDFIGAAYNAGMYTQGQ